MNLETTMSTIKVKLPDGSVRELPVGSTGMDLAKSISPSLAKKSIALDNAGKIQDLFEQV